MLTSAGRYPAVDADLRRVAAVNDPPFNRQSPLRAGTHPYFGLLSSTSGSHVAISGNTVISAMHSTIMQKNGIDAQAT